MKKLLLAASLLVGAAGVTTLNPNEVEATQIQTASYKVVKGDTYYSIAKKTGSYLRTLETLNATPSDKLKVGQHISVARSIEEGAISWVYILDVDQKRNRMTVQLLENKKMFYVYMQPDMTKALKGYQYKDDNIATITVFEGKNDTRILNFFTKGMY